jgi:hypothetical protein
MKLADLLKPFHVVDLLLIHASYHGIASYSFIKGYGHSVARTIFASPYWATTNNSL